MTDKKAEKDDSKAKKDDSVPVGKKTEAIDEKMVKLSEVESIVEMLLAKNYPKSITKEVGEVHTENIIQGKPIPISELGKQQAGIEPVAENDFAMERFMEDILTIIVHTDPSADSLEIITPSVNGINQPIIRGVQSKVKRKYVEVLARSSLTRYKQKRHPVQLENISNIPRTASAYPFAVLHDPRPNGSAWLDAIQKAAAA